MDTLLPFALLCLTSFFTLTNPLGTMPVFLTMTQGMTEKERRFIVTRATLTAFIIIMVFTFAGQFLFKFFGISTNGFRIAGGFIIFKIGYDMLQARYTPMKLKDEEIKTYANDISITPLGIPMLCDAGCPYHGAERRAHRLHRLHLPADLLHPPGLHPAGGRAGRNGQQRHDAPHGSHPDGDRRGVLRGRHEAHFGRRADGELQDAAMRKLY